MTTRWIFASLAPLALTACLGPLVKDTPGASAHLLPADATVPSVSDDGELAAQITLDDGIDDRAFAAAGNQLARGTGWSAGAAVRYWSLGAVTRAPSPLYQLYDAAGTQLAHPALVDALPGDPGYSPLHTLTRVVVTDAYHGELITTAAALGDAIDLGLVQQPAITNTFVDSPVVLPGTPVEIGAGLTATPEIIYARGVQVGLVRFGGALGVEPAADLLPTAQVSFLRAAHGASYDATRPIFQATIPTAAATSDVTYTPVSEVIDVDLAEGVDPVSITSDAQLFTRGADGAIMSSTASVARFEVTPALQLLQLQFTEGSL